MWEVAVRNSHDSNVSWHTNSLVLHSLMADWAPNWYPTERHAQQTFSTTCDKKPQSGMLASMFDSKITAKNEAMTLHALYQTIFWIWLCCWLFCSHDRWQSVCRSFQLSIGSIGSIGAFSVLCIQSQSAECGCGGADGVHSLPASVSLSNWISGASQDKDGWVRHRHTLRWGGQGEAQKGCLSALSRGSTSQNLQMCVCVW